ncbi:hypothetical protein SporoP37_15605 [Sporosarcina sp. P37]|uniref:YpoC family protein n=1 Tax=unclassified Sporosarcina TaxID=2647733 RepID=UPI0009BD3CDD|nr:MULTISPECIES: hypothetical protein [unclassified Sporosarcina]ARD49480.1 hypothetical protein SporoP33_15270 [Sporosarcina sp. P33]ARK25955.1 hypothetical protein SporoP37_15605 [Sporosarcina sp. P37]PID18224.1 hypothetical protein CSV62_09125 [Sporosarcina sp. P35]
MSYDELKEHIQRVLTEWEQQQPELEKMYAVRDERRLTLIEPAIDQLAWLIAQSEIVRNPHTGNMHHALEPNNYTERIEFIKLQKSSHYALIQLMMLYDEMKKKAARLRVQQ